jgi:hypothetical protein
MQPAGLPIVVSNTEQQRSANYERYFPDLANCSTQSSSTNP